MHYDSKFFWITFMVLAIIAAIASSCLAQGVAVPERPPVSTNKPSKPSSQPYPGYKNPFMESCEDVVKWANQLVAARRTVNKQVLANVRRPPARTKVYPANLHLCYECEYEDPTKGVVIIGGHGGWSHFFPSVVRVQRNCDCERANMDIRY